MKKNRIQKNPSNNQVSAFMFNEYLFLSPEECKFYMRFTCTDILAERAFMLVLSFAVLHLSESLKEMDSVRALI